MVGAWTSESDCHEAKNIFRNNFNTALDEQGTLRMLKQIHTKDSQCQLRRSELPWHALASRSFVRISILQSFLRPRLPPSPALSKPP